MNAQQENLLWKVRDNLRESRDILDHLRFRMEDQLTENEREKINRCYEFICKANDQI